MLETRANRLIEHFWEEFAQSNESALLLDYDGTLAPFRVDRGRALPYTGVTGLLQEIIDTGHTRVVLMTGRPARDIVPLLGLASHPEIWGAYGLQRLKPDGTCTMPRISETVAQALSEAMQWLNEAGLSNLGEVKPASVAVHWRGLEDSVVVRVRDAVLLGWRPIADRAHMILQDFDGGVEILMPGSDKGDALRDFLISVDPGTPVAFLGDDQTDEHAFRALQNQGLRVLVRPEWRETAADMWLRPPEELLNFLFQWLAACWSAMRPSPVCIAEPLVTGRGCINEEAL